MVVLDTDIFTLLVAAHERVVGRFRETADEVVISVVTRIEVLQGRFAGIMKAADGEEGARAQARLNKAERDLSPFRVLPFTETTAAVFDRLRANKRLKKVGLADLLIASITLANGAPLVTRNEKHFKLVPGLTNQNWAD